MHLRFVTSRVARHGLHGARTPACHGRIHRRTSSRRRRRSSAARHIKTSRGEVCGECHDDTARRREMRRDENTAIEPDATGRSLAPLFLLDTTIVQQRADTPRKPCLQRFATKQLRMVRERHRGDVLERASTKQLSSLARNSINTACSCNVQPLD